MNKNRRSRKQLAEINVVPYIDVMLVLLIIFMITAPLLSQGVKVELPKANAKPLSIKQKQPVIISVDHNGRYYLNLSEAPKIPLPPRTLLAKVTAELITANQAGEKQTVLIKGDHEVNYDHVVQLMVLLQHAGIDKVGLMTEDLNSN